MAELNRLSGPTPPPVPPGASQKWHEARLYQADPDLKLVMEIAVELRQPLLITGDPGCGKTSAAYWAAWRMGLTPDQLVHAQIRSDETAERLKYEFDAVRFLRESDGAQKGGVTLEHLRAECVRPGPLYRAFEGSQTRPMALLLDEIDKAPRDLPNDLLHEFDQLEFEVRELLDKDKRPRRVTAGKGPENSLSLIIFTSNGERRLPDAFLRRCLHHHLSFDASWRRRIVDARMGGQGGIRRAPQVIDHAITRFVQIQSVYGLHHRPGPAELLVWLRALALSAGITPEELRDRPLAQLPVLGALLKDHADRKLVASNT